MNRALCSVPKTAYKEIGIWLKNGSNTSETINRFMAWPNMSAPWREEPNPVRTTRIKRYYWTVHPKPNTCDKCKAMAGLKYASEPQRPHPNCKCEIKKHYIGVDIMGTLEGYKAHDTHSFATGQKVTVEVRNIGGFVAGADIQADDADWRSTGWIAPGLSVTVSFTKFGEVPLPWKIYLEYNAGDNSTLQDFIRG